MHRQQSRRNQVGHKCVQLGKIHWSNDSFCCPLSQSFDGAVENLVAGSMCAEVDRSSALVRVRESAVAFALHHEKTSCFDDSFVAVGDMNLDSHDSHSHDQLFRGSEACAGKHLHDVGISACSNVCLAAEGKRHSPVWVLLCIHSWLDSKRSPSLEWLQTSRQSDDEKFGRLYARI